MPVNVEIHALKWISKRIKLTLPCPPSSLWFTHPNLLSQGCCSKDWGSYFWNYPETQAKKPLDAIREELQTFTYSSEPIWKVSRQTFFLLKDLNTLGHLWCSLEQVGLAANPHPELPVSDLWNRFLSCLARIKIRGRGEISILALQTNLKLLCLSSLWAFTSHICTTALLFSSTKSV